MGRGLSNSSSDVDGRESDCAVIGGRGEQIRLCRVPRDRVHLVRVHVVELLEQTQRLTAVHFRHVENSANCKDAQDFLYLQKTETDINHILWNNTFPDISGKSGT